MLLHNFHPIYVLLLLKGLDVEVASNLVDQTTELTKSIVRRRIAHKFQDLRVRVLRDVIGPFAREAVTRPSKGEGDKAAAAITGSHPHVVQITQAASVALSDGMQLVDDVVRSLLSRNSMMGSPSAPVDPSVARRAAERGARRFALWLASALEMLAGLDDPNPVTTLAVQPSRERAEEDDGGARSVSAARAISTGSFNADDDSAASDPDQFGDIDDDEAMEYLDTLLADMDENATAAASADFTLAIAEMCRLAERSVAENMNQSIAFAASGDAKAVDKGNRFFESSAERMVAKINIDSNGAIAARFNVAAIRTLQRYAVGRGNDAAAVGSADLSIIAQCASYDIPEAPNETAWRVLEIAKLTSISCASVFGGELMASPIPSFPDEDDGGLSLTGHMPLGGGGISAIKGLQLDVERMFIEKVQIYPDQNYPVDFTRNSVVATVLKVAFKALIEQSRTCIFTARGYRQMQTNCEFLRHLLPHYVADETLADGTNPLSGLSNLLNDVMLNVGDRCVDVECVGVNEYYDEARRTISTPLGIARRFFEGQEDLEEGSVLTNFVITEE